MMQESYRLDAKKAEIALAAMHETCFYRKWSLLACHIDRTHVHVVIIADYDPKRVRGNLKAYSSRALTKSGFDDSIKKRWTSGGSTRYLWDKNAVVDSIEYVMSKQGRFLAKF